MHVVEATHFQLYKRAKHVFSESLRVLQFRKTCLDTPERQTTTSAHHQVERLGRLMNESQQSCQTLFECSCPEIDHLTKLCGEAGAFGSRLTGACAPKLARQEGNVEISIGAGWGGCTVSLVAEDQVDRFIQKIKETYPPYQNLEGDRLSEVIFATRPSSGACGEFRVVFFRVAMC